MPDAKEFLDRLLSLGLACTSEAMTMAHTGMVISQPVAIRAETV